MTSYEEFKGERLKNPKVRAEYEALEPKYKHIEDLIKESDKLLEKNTLHPEAFTFKDLLRLKQINKEIANLEGSLPDKSGAKDKRRQGKLAHKRGKYGEARGSKRCGTVLVGKRKLVRLPKGEVIKIPINKFPDDMDEVFCYERKWLKSSIKTLDKYMTQAQNNCPEGYTPVLALGCRTTGVVYYILLERDFIDLHC